MTNDATNLDPNEWIKREKGTDRRIRTFAYLGWGTVILALVAYGIYHVVGIVEYVEAVRQMPQYQLTFSQTFSRLVPLLSVLGALGLLVGTLSTVATFMRFRTVSLEQIQARLASIESSLTSEDRL